VLIMGRPQVAKYLKFFGFAIFSILSALTILIMSIYALNEHPPTAFAQQEEKNMTTTQYLTKSEVSNQNVESVMGTFLSPKSLLASAIDQIRNGNAKSNTTAYTTLGTNIVRDSDTVLLSHQILLPKDFIHIYDSTPYRIMNGHLTAKLPCDTKLESPVEILVGELTNLKPAKLEMLKELSKPGYMCLYYANLTFPGFLAKPGATTITDITLFNPTGLRVVLLNTSTVVVGVNEIVPLTNKMISNKS
jgi:hypothetical protein